MLAMTVLIIRYPVPLFTFPYTSVFGHRSSDYIITNFELTIINLTPQSYIFNEPTECLNLKNEHSP